MTQRLRYEAKMAENELNYEMLWSNMKAILSLSMGVDWSDKAGLLALMGKLEVMQIAQRNANALLSNRDIQEAVTKGVKISAK